MKLFILATLFLAGSAVAGDCTRASSTPVRRHLPSTSPSPISIPDKKPCQPDGSMDNCASKTCIRLPGEPQGTCKPSK
ncbi:hypothetical protein SI65_04669 [Aspergillus cristatus]|uniref:Uncharacterized protein n=1 Tax=Aspergillus cristatus TaxID=573508 RepID=A0A1E3BFF3_ASPCR|nr:hypothetical protein SI65_04669 [Aspergillus cristatus]